MDFSKIHPFQLIAMIVFVALAIISLILFSMCGNSNLCNKGPGKVNVGKVLVWGTLPAEAVNAELGSLKQQKAEYAGVTYEQKPPETFAATLADALASGTGPDLVIVDQEQLLSQENKLQLLPFKSVPQRDFVNNYLPSAQVYMTGTGVYGFPIAIDPLMLYYNKSSLASIGVAQPPTTWEAVTGLAQNLTRKTPEGIVTKSLVPFGEYGNVSNARAIISVLLLQSGTKITEQQATQLRSTLGNVDVQGASGVSPSEAAISFYAQFANPSKTVYTWNRALPEARQSFLAGDLALYPGFASEVTVLKQGNPNLEFDMAPIPQADLSGARVTYAHVYALAITKQSHNTNGAFSAAYMMASAQFAPVLDKALGMAPALRAALTPSSDDLYAPVYYPEALAAKVWLSPAPSVVDTIFGTMIGNIASGRSSAHDALFQADQALDAALGT
jgi:ABC-type glycerol-3-phosphate transport system substrate-binding protein